MTTRAPPMIRTGDPARRRRTSPSSMLAADQGERAKRHQEDVDKDQRGERRTDQVHRVGVQPVEQRARPQQQADQRSAPGQPHRPEQNRHEDEVCGVASLGDQDEWRFGLIQAVNAPHEPSARHESYQHGDDERDAVGERQIVLNRQCVHGKPPTRSARVVAVRRFAAEDHAQIRSRLSAAAAQTRKASMCLSTDPGCSVRQNNRAGASRASRAARR